MQYLWCCEIKKVIYNGAFVKVALFLVITNVISCFFVPTNNGLTKEEIERYPYYIQEICTQSEVIQTSPLYKGNDYSIEVAEQTQKVYEKLIGVQLISINSIGTEIAIGNWIGDAIRFLFCCISGMFQFQADKENGLSLLFFSTKNGRKKDYWCKIGSALLCNILFCIFTLCIQLGIGGAWGGISDFNMPIQVIPDYYQCPYSLTIGELIYINGIVKVWAVFVQTIVVSMFYISLEFILAWLGIIMICILSVVFYIGIPEYSVFQLIKYVNLASFSQTQNLIGNLIYLRMGNEPISYKDGMCVVTLVIILLGLRIGKYNFKYHLSTRSSKLKPRVKIKQKTESLFMLEMKKLMRPHTAYLIFGISIVVQLLFYSMMCSGIGFEERLFEKRLKQLEGVYTQEMYEMLLQEKEDVQNGQRIYSDAQVSCLDKILSISEYLENVKANTEVQYVYSGGYEALAGIRKVSISYQTIAITISLFLFLLGIFLREQKYGMCFLNQTTVNYKKHYRTKICLVMVISVVTCVFWWCPECIFIFQNFYIPNGLSPAISVPMFSNVPSWMMLWQVIAIVWLMRIIMSVITGLLIAIFSYEMYLSSTY